MATITGITISEIAKELGLKRHAVEQRLITAGIKPLTYEALYDPSALEVVRNSPKRGRPAKGKPAN
jgi:predicted ArsR family transcriptional regulator